MRQVESAMEAPSARNKDKWKNPRWRNGLLGLCIVLLHMGFWVLFCHVGSWKLSNFEFQTKEKEARVQLTRVKSKKGKRRRKMLLHFLFFIFSLVGPAFLYLTTIFTLKYIFYDIKIKY